MIRFVVPTEPSTIFSSNGSGLGDVWSSINYAITFAHIWNCRVEFATHYKKRNKQLKDVTKKVEECVPEFRDSWKIIITEKEPTFKPVWWMVYSIPYFPTSVRWDPSCKESDYVCYSFLGKTHKEKHFADGGVKVLADLQAKGLKTVNLTWPQTIKETIELLSKCREYHGVTVGASHIAHSVGCPTKLYANNFNYMPDCHKNKTFDLMDR